MSEYEITRAAFEAGFDAAADLARVGRAMAPRPHRDAMQTVCRAVERQRDEMADQFMSRPASPQPSKEGAEPCPHCNGTRRDTITASNGGVGEVVPCWACAASVTDPPRRTGNYEKASRLVESYALGSVSDLQSVMDRVVSWLSPPPSKEVEGREGLRYPIKLDDDYPCRGKDANGKDVVWGDLLSEGDETGPGEDGEEGGEALYAEARVVRGRDGLWVIWDPSIQREHIARVLGDAQAPVAEPDGPTVEGDANGAVREDGAEGATHGINFPCLGCGRVHPNEWCYPNPASPEEC